MSLCPGKRAASLLVFNTETRPTTNGAENLRAPESKIARTVLKLYESLRTE